MQTRDRLQPRVLVLAAAALVGHLVACQKNIDASAHPQAAFDDRPSVDEGILRDGDSTPEISTAEMRRTITTPDVVVFDARPFEEYAESHIPGARSVPAKPGLPPAQYTADAVEVERAFPDRATALVLYCNGPYCGRSKRFAAELRKAGYLNVRRYQLGIPTWRALGGVTQIEKEALVRLLAADTTAVLVDARETTDPVPPLPRARRVPLRDASKAKDDGRLPMTDHNTRIFVVGDNAPQARAVAEAIVHDAFHNVSFFDGSPAEIPELAK
jgi:rhodanese-related sulfurtransferase